MAAAPAGAATAKYDRSLRPGLSAVPWGHDSRLDPSSGTCRHGAVHTLRLKETQESCRRFLLLRLLVGNVPMVATGCAGVRTLMRQFPLQNLYVVVEFCFFPRMNSLPFPVFGDDHCDGSFVLFFCGLCRRPSLVFNLLLLSRHLAPRARRSFHGCGQRRMLMLRLEGACGSDLP